MKPVVSSLQELKSSLASIQPNSETAQLITYALVVTVIAGMFIYHYIKSQEEAKC